MKRSKVISFLVMDSMNDDYFQDMKPCFAGGLCGTRGPAYLSRGESKGQENSERLFAADNCGLYES